jgi:pimeloyl-ACP methyl ester carboxylesterase
LTEKLPLVLVHGGAHGAWCWAPTVDLLDGPVLTVDLPPKAIRRGDARRHDHPAELDTLSVGDFAASLLADIDTAGHDRVVLVGHSMGGLSIAEVARLAPGRVAHLVFVSCIVPPEGGSAMDALPADITTRTGNELERSADDPDRGLGDDAARFMFCNDMSDEQARFVLDRIGNEAIGPLMEKVTRVGIPAALPKTFVRLARDQSLPPDNQDLQIRHLEESPGGTVDVIDIDTGHNVMVSRPDLLAPVLDRIRTT